MPRVPVLLVLCTAVDMVRRIVACFDVGVGKDSMFHMDIKAAIISFPTTTRNGPVNKLWPVA